MNRLLADTLSFLNGLLAIVIVLAGAAVGYSSSLAAGNSGVGLLVGAVLGFIVAGAVCGLIAFLVLIEGHLRRLAEGRGGYSHDGRREPGM